MKKLFSSILFFSILIIVGLNSCNNATDPLEVSSPVHGIPIVPGLLITGREGPETLGIWRNPHLPNGEYHFCVNCNDNIQIDIPGPLNIRLETPYPNPTDSFMTIQFALSTSTEVSMWLVRAKLPEDDAENINTTSGGVFVSSNNKIELIKDLPLATGVYQVACVFKDGEGGSLPGGFYRVYFTADGHTLWCDVLFAKEINDLPPDL